MYNLYSLTTHRTASVNQKYVFFRWTIVWDWIGLLFVLLLTVSQLLIKVDTISVLIRFFRQKLYSINCWDQIRQNANRYCLCFKRRTTRYRQCNRLLHHWISDQQNKILVWHLRPIFNCECDLGREFVFRHAYIDLMVYWSQSLQRSLALHKNRNIPQDWRVWGQGLA